MTLIQLSADTDQMLHQLRAKLKVSEERLAEYQTIPATDPGYLYTAGQIIELLTFCEWLRGLIAEIEGGKV